MQAPREASPHEAGDISPAPEGTPEGIVPQDEGGEGTPPSQKKEDGFDPSKFVSKEEFDKLSEKNKHLFARATKAEGKLKEKGIVDDAPSSPPTTDSPADPFSLAKQVGILKDYDEQEIDYIQFVANGKGISAAEAVKSHEVETYLKGKRGADYKKSTVPSPGSPTSVGAKLPDASAIGKMSKEDHAKLDQEAMKRQGFHGNVF